MNGEENDGQGGREGEREKSCANLECAMKYGVIGTRHAVTKIDYIHALRGNN